MKNTITFYTSAPNRIVHTCYLSTLSAIKNSKGNVHTSDLSSLSFDLLDTFDAIYLIHEGQKYNLKLGLNEWTPKELRKAHNLLKLVKSYIIN